MLYTFKCSHILPDKRRQLFENTEIKEEEEEEEDAKIKEALHGEGVSPLLLTTFPSYAYNTSMCYDPFLVPLDSEDEEVEEVST